MDFKLLYASKLRLKYRFLIFMCRIGKYGAWFFVCILKQKYGFDVEKQKYGSSRVYKT